MYCIQDMVVSECGGGTYVVGRVAQGGGGEVGWGGGYLVHCFKKSKKHVQY